MKSLFRTRYKIVRDNWSGYEVRFRYWWMPFYLQCHIGTSVVNTWGTLEKAKEFIEEKKKGGVYHD